MKESTIKNIKISKYLSLIKNKKYFEISQIMKRPLGTIKRWINEDVVFNFDDEIIINEVNLLIDKIDVGFIPEKTNKIKICINCSCEFSTKFVDKSKFCSIKCHKDFSFKERYNNWINGFKNNYSERWYKKAVIIRDGYKCSECDISIWN